MPPRTASTRKPTASASDTRFEIVMVKRSLAAAKAIRAGNNRRRARSRIMEFQSSCGWREVGNISRNLAARDEQSGNDTVRHQILAIRHAKARIASVKARQTISTGARSRPSAEEGVFLARATAGLRISGYAIKKG